MAVITGFAACNVGGVFPRRSSAVVAGSTFTDDLCVVDCVRRHKAVRVVTVLAHNCCLDVSGVLAGGIGSVVTAAAVVDDVGVIEISWQPSGR